MHRVTIAMSLCILQAAASAYCPSYPTVRQELAASRVVALGTVQAERVVPDGEREFYVGIKYYIAVQRVFKGTPPNVMMVFSENSSGRFPMQIGGQYLIFASPEADLLPGEVPLAISYCGNSGLAAEAQPAVHELERTSPRRLQSKGPTSTLVRRPQ